MKTVKIYITDFDLQRLNELICVADEFSQLDQPYLAKLREELENARVIPQHKIPADVVTMNSTVLLTDIDTNEDMIFQLVFSCDADFTQNKISVLAPIGTAMLGYKVGDTITWKVPAGPRRLAVREILYQPEANGVFSM